MNQTSVNFLSIIKNAAIYLKATPTVNSNILTHKLIDILYREGKVQSYRTEKKDYLENIVHETIILLRSRYEKSAFSNLKIVSTPAKQIFLSINVICRLPSKQTTFIFTTNKGLLSLQKCKNYRIGGVLLFSC